MQTAIPLKSSNNAALVHLTHDGVYKLELDGRAIGNAALERKGACRS